MKTKLKRGSMKGTLSGCLDPIPVQLRTQADSGSRGAIDAHMREVGRNKVGLIFSPLL